MFFLQYIAPQPERKLDLESLREPVFDLTVAAMLAQQSTSPGRPLETLYSAFASTQDKDRTPGQAVRICLLAYVLEKPVRPLPSDLQRRMGRSDVPEIQQLASVCSSLARLSAQQARLLERLRPYVGPVALAAAEKAHLALSSQADADRVHADIARLETAAVVKLGVYGLALMVALFGGCAVWFMYASYVRAERLRGPARDDAGPDLPASEPLWKAFSLYLITYLLLAVAAAAVAPDWLSDTWLMVLHYVAACAVAIPVAFLILKGSGARPSQIGVRTSSLATDLLWGVGGFLAATSLAAAVGLVWTAVTSVFGGAGEFVSPVVELFGPEQPLASVLVVLAVIGVLGPITEELFFRGMLLSAAAKDRGRNSGVWLSALAFALIHPGALQMFPSYIALGLVFARLALVRRSLLPSIVAHSLNNIFYAAIYILLQV